MMPELEPAPALDLPELPQSLQSLHLRPLAPILRAPLMALSAAR